MILCFLYLVILTALVILLVLSIRRNTRKLWVLTLSAAAVSAAGAFCLMRYYDQLPGYGMMPGLSYFGEVLSSMGASALYAGLFLVTLTAMLLRRGFLKRR